MDAQNVLAPHSAVTHIGKPNARPWAGILGGIAELSRAAEQLALRNFTRPRRDPAAPASDDLICIECRTVQCEGLPGHEATCRTGRVLEIVSSLKCVTQSTTKESEKSHTPAAVASEGAPRPLYVTGEQLRGYFAGEPIASEFTVAEIEHIQEIVERTMQLHGIELIESHAQRTPRYAGGAR